MNEVAKLGYLSCIIYLRESGCEWDNHTCSRAASGGHLHCQKYLHENGHLNCLRYAYTNKCRVVGFVSYAAAKNRHKHCLMYAVDVIGCKYYKLGYFSY
jgi:hypothetical protein